MFCAKTPQAADEMMEQLKTRTIRKQYIARVVGEFPAYIPTHPILYTVANNDKQW